MNNRTEERYIWLQMGKSWASPVAQMVKRLLQCTRPGFDPWVGRISWRRKWQPTPVLLPGKFPRTEEPGRLHSMGIAKTTEQLQRRWMTLCDPMNCNPPGSSVRGFLRIRILEWIAVPSSRGSSPPRDQTLFSYLSCIGRWILYH